MTRFLDWLTERGVPLIFALCVVGFAVLLILPRSGKSQAPDYDSWLVLVVDVSGSINVDEYATQRDGYVEVLLDPIISQALDRTAIAIVEFGTDAVVAVAWTDVRGAGAAYREWKRPFSGSTCVWCGLNLAIQLLQGKSGKRMIDISGDGAENVKEMATVHQLRDLATLQGIEINTLALLVQPDHNFYGGYGGFYGGYGGGSSNVTTTTDGLEQWYQELATGFAMAIGSLDDLADALKRKLFAEIASNVR